MFISIHTSVQHIIYSAGGYLTITDANLMLNRIIPSHFPAIFGETQDQRLDKEATEKAFSALTEEVLITIETTNLYLCIRGL